MISIDIPVTAAEKSFKIKKAAKSSNRHQSWFNSDCSMFFSERRQYRKVLTSNTADAKRLKKL